MEYKLKNIKEYRKEMEIDIYKSNINKVYWLREFFEGWVKVSDFEYEFMTDYTSDSYNQDFDEWIGEQSLEEIWELVAGYHLNTIKKYVLERVTEEEIFSRMTPEELKEYNKIQKELELFKVARKV